MPTLLRGEMTRHIDKCYPPGKDAAREPVPNELSQLIFYLNAHRGKISKAAHVLLTRANHFAYKSNYGSLSVTALIMSEIVVKVSANFGLFEEEALIIVQLLLEHSAKGDTDLLEVAKELFANYMEHNRGLLFPGNPNYCREFVDVVQDWADIAKGQLVASKVIALHALASLPKSRTLETSCGHKAVDVGMPGILANLPQNPSVYSKYTSTDAINTKNGQSKNGDEETGSKLEPTMSRSPDDLLALSATSALKAFLNTSPSFGRVVHSLLKWLVSTKNSFQPELLVSIVRWVPPQNRFLVTKELVQVMWKLPTRDTKHLLIYSDYLNAMLKSDFAKTDLSVIDVLQMLMRLQRRYIDSPADTNAAQVQHVVEKLRDNIGHLADVHVYAGQCSDMVSTILLKYSLLLESSSGNSNASSANSTANDTNYLNGNHNTGASTAAASIRATTTNGSLDNKKVRDNETSLSTPTTNSAGPRERSVGVTVNDFQDLLELIERESKTHDGHRMNAALWDGTQWLLASRHAQTLSLYCQCFTKFYQLNPTVFDIASKRGSYYFRQICLVLLSPDLLPTNYVAIYNCLVALIEYSGTHSKHFLPWLFKVASISSCESKESSHLVFASSVVLASILAIFRVSNREGPAAAIFDFIQHKVTSKRWLPGITYPVVNSPEEAIAAIANSSVSFTTTKNSTDYAAIDSLNLNSEERELIDSPVCDLDAPLETEELRAIKGRSPSLSGFRNMRLVSAQSQTPSVVDSQVGALRRKQIEMLRLRQPTRGDKTQPAKSKHRSQPSNVSSTNGTVNGTINGTNGSTEESNGHASAASHTRNPTTVSPQQIVSLINSINIEKPQRGNLTV